MNHGILPTSWLYLTANPSLWRNGDPQDDFSPCYANTTYDNCWGVDINNLLMFFGYVRRNREWVLEFYSPYMAALMIGRLSLKMYPIPCSKQKSKEELLVRTSRS
ncbi:unnamed protein product [Cuscuta epithymum]|uniref:Uncharacterized protein n=1 Tax=Cuscuta epithymum TaxID=186058 RepID=A0AAV0E8F8_9ASTE|nr:unnamed protein product [Cuscuta epithymum]